MTPETDRGVEALTKNCSEKTNENSSSLSDHGSIGRENIVKSLIEQVARADLKSSTRLIILVSLALNGKLHFTELLRLTGVGKGSLGHHLEKLEQTGLIKLREVSTFGGIRTTAEITSDGRLVYESYVTAFKKLVSSPLVKNQSKSNTK